MKSITLLVFAYLLLGVAGCGRQRIVGGSFEVENFRSIEIGQSIESCIENLGSPAKAKIYYMGGGRSVSRDLNVNDLGALIAASSEASTYMVLYYKEEVSRADKVMLYEVVFDGGNVTRKTEGLSSK